MKTERDIYARAGTEYVAAYDKMLDERPEKCPPPSLEVFQQEEKDTSNAFRRVSPTELSTKLVKSPESSLNKKDCEALMRDIESLGT